MTKKLPTKATLLTTVGGLSKPSKMPGYGWSTSATMCNVGSKLRGVKGSVCASCYALKGRYVFPRVIAALRRRHILWANDRTMWVSNMIAAIRRVSVPDDTGYSYFRWFDSGDIHNSDMLRDIVAVCAATPNVKHWLPTKEFKVVRDFQGVIPDNLVIRVSSPMVEQEPLGFSHTSTVTRDKSAVTCPSSKQGNKCLTCRACWDKNVGNVAYGAH